MAIELLEKGDLHQKSKKFLDWAAMYDAPNSGIKRTLKNQNDWLKTLKCPVLRIEGTYTMEESTKLAIEEIVR